MLWQRKGYSMRVKIFQIEKLKLARLLTFLLCTLVFVSNIEIASGQESITPSSGTKIKLKLIKVIKGSGDINDAMPVAISPDGKTIAFGYHKQIRLWNVNKAKVTAILNGHTKVVEVLSFSCDGKILASASSSMVIMWDVETKSLRNRLSRPDYGEGEKNLEITHIAFSTDGQQLAVGSINAFQKNPKMQSIGPVDLWNVTNGEWIRRIADGNYGELQSGIGRIIFSPDSKTLAVAVGKGNINDENFLFFLRDVTTGKIINKYELPVFMADISSDWKLFTAISTFPKHLFKLMELNTGRELLTLEDNIYSTTFSPDNKLLALGTEDGAIKLLDINTYRVITTAYHPGYEEVAHVVLPMAIGEMEFSADGQWLVSKSFGIVALWQIVPDTPLKKAVTSKPAHNENLIRKY